jgi:nicotinamidase-related amidase
MSDSRNSALTQRDDAVEQLFAYRARMNDFRINAESSALVIVDLQYGSASGDHGYANVYRAIGYGDVVDGYIGRIRQRVIPSVQRLQAAFRAAGAPVIFLTVGTVTGDLSDMPPRFRRAAQHWREHGLTPPYALPGSREMMVLDEIAPRPGEPVIAKVGASGFTASTLERVLWNRNVRELAFCGVATAYCVESTLRDAADRGFDCLLVEDGCADVTDAIHQRGLESCRAFGRVAPADTVIAELTAAPRQSERTVLAGSVA